MTLQTIPDTICRKCGYKWRKNVSKPKSCPECKRRGVALPLEKEQKDDNRNDRT